MKRWLIISGSMIAGLIVGDFVGALVSVNVLGLSYEASFSDIWKDDPVAIWIMVGLATAGGTAGCLLAWRRTAP